MVTRIISGTETDQL